MKAIETTYGSIDTPALLIDLDLWQANVDEILQEAFDAGVALRPHVKVHQCPDLAKMQIASGAQGIEVGLIDQAIVMADAGIQDIIVAHPFYGDQKLRKAEQLLTKPGLTLAFVIDMFEQGEALSQIGQKLGLRIPLHLKVDTGGGRYGVLPGAPILDLARQINGLRGNELVGIYAHESPAQIPPTEDGVSRVALEVGAIMCETAQFLRRNGLDIRQVSTGASPTVIETCRWIKAGMLTEITEVHPGQIFMGDIACSHTGGCNLDRIAISLLGTIVSTAHHSRAIIDVGFKALGTELMIDRIDSPDFFWKGMPSYGLIRGRDDLWLGRLGAESGFIYYKENARTLRLGDRLEIIPNSATLLLNIHDKAYGIRSGEIERMLYITGRGQGS